MTVKKSCYNYSTKKKKKAILIPFEMQKRINTGIKGAKLIKSLFKRGGGGRRFYRKKRRNTTPNRNLKTITKERKKRG